MPEILTPTSTSYKNTDHGPGTESFLTEIKASDAPTSRLSSTARKPRTQKEALENLKAEPGYETLVSTLVFLRTGDPDFSITSPSPLAAQLVHVLVSETVPTYWDVLHSPNGKKSRKQGGSAKISDLDLLLACLRSVTGVNAVLLGLKQSIEQSKKTKRAVGGQDIQSILKTLLNLLSELLEGNETVRTIWIAVWHASEILSKKKALWSEFLSIVGGKILGICAEAEDIVNNLSKKVDEKYWLSDGVLYSKWIANNISHWARNQDSDKGSLDSCAELLGTSFRLGYNNIIVKEILTSLVLQKQDYSQVLEKLISRFPSFEQRHFILASIKLISSDFLSSIVTSEDDALWWRSDAIVISAAAGLIKLILANEDSRKAQILAWLTSPSGAGVGEGIAIRRAVIAALVADKNFVETILDKILQQFGDQLYIRHTPAMQQEVHAQILLLSAGYVHRKAPLHLAMMMRSGSHLSVVSNRLAASSPRARFLGMIVGEALSGLVDKGDKKMDFKLEEMQTPEAKWYKSLVTVQDTIGSLSCLVSGPVSTVPSTPKPIQPKPPAKSGISHGSSKIVAIQEISDDGEDEESDGDGLTPYAKPDSDDEDSDEDATLITRNKPTAPVYIRDLITYLRDVESYDKQKLGLQAAAPLIRRKANFGTEVTAHAEELATLLVGLQDKYDMDNFQDLRLQGMIAILVAQPRKMGQWFSKTFFDGDYSLSQRASVLTTLGLGARELGGFGSEGADLSSKKALGSSSFPSKELPERMHKRYALPAPGNSEVDRLSTRLSNTMIAPMAAELADKLTGPSILKVRTFSSRMAVEKKRKKPIANELAKVLADGFFFPLTGRFFVHLKAYGSSRSNVVFQPYLLALFIKTLSLLIHASGPSTLSLPQMTSEFWDLLLSLRTQSIGDVTVIEALLFAFLTILEVNDDKRRLVEAHGRQMLETQDWVEGVLGRAGAGAASEEDEKVRMLAAGCLVRIREVVEKYQALLMGDLAVFRN